jgi:membrane protein YdbS with pleckstrin-like domain
MPFGKVLIELRPSWWNYWWLALLALVLLAGGIYLTVTLNVQAYLIVSALAVVPLLMALWNRYSMKVFVDEQQVEISEGILSVVRNSIYCADVRTTATRQTLLQRIVGIGTVEVGSAGTGRVEIVAKGVPQPRKLEKIIEEQKIICNKASDRPSTD